jgi:GNAT superfamily N-acetyltransferase
MSIELKEVTNLHDLKAFIRYPLTLYKKNPYYVPSFFNDEMNTLRWDKNPAFAEVKARYWLAYRDGKPVGRVAAMLVPKHEQKWGEKYLRFGWLDFIVDPEVVQALIGAVEKWALELGMHGIHGPLGFTDLDREGMLIEGFDKLATLATSYNYPYYPKRLEALGYAKDVDWVEYEIKLTSQSEEKIFKAADIIAKRFNLHMFNGSKKELRKIAPQLFSVWNEAYRNLYGTTPLSEAQVKVYVDSYFGMVITDYIPLVLDAKDKVIAFGVTFPSFSKALQKNKGSLFPFGFIPILRAMKKNDRADLYLVGIIDEYLGKGVNALLMAQIYRAFLKHGIQVVESNPNLETNDKVQAMWKYFDNHQHKRRRVFVKHLS